MKNPNVNAIPNNIVDGESLMKAAKYVGSPPKTATTALLMLLSEYCEAVSIIGCG
jgi:hypothetical protein